jgi:MFS family permease
VEDRLLNRDGRLLVSYILLNSIPVGYMNVVPLVYLAEIGYDPSVIGAIYGASALANTVALIPFGFLADRYARKWFVLVGSLIPSVSFAIFGLTLNPAWLVFAGALGGVGFAGGFAFAIINPALIPLIANSSSPRRRTAFFGVAQGTWTLALSIGAVLSVVPGALGYLLHQGTSVSHSESYFLMAGLMVVSVVPLLAYRETRATATTVVAASRADDLLPYVTKRRLDRVRIRLPVTSWGRILRFSVVYALTGVGLGVLVQLLPTWFALRFGVSEDAVGLWIGLANAVSIVAIPMIPRLARWRGTLVSSAIAGVGATAFLAAMPFAGTFEGAASLFVARSVLEAMGWAMLLSYTMGVVTDAERATTTGIAFTAWGVGATVGTLVGGELLGAGLLSLPFVIGVLAYVAGSCALPLFFGSSRLPEEAVSGPRGSTGPATDK